MRWKQINKLKYYNVVILLILLSGLLASDPLPARAQVSAGDHQVILVLCDFLELNDLATPDLPNLHNFFSKGGVALLNTNTGGSRSRINAAATVNAGSVAVGTPQETLAFGPGESYLQLDPVKIFESHTGTTAGKGNQVVLDLPILLRLNATDQVKASLGALGDSLHQAGLTTGVLGNADLLALPQRSSAVIPMDQRGIIDYGDISTGILQSDKNGALGYHTNYLVLEQRLQQLLPQTSFMVVDLGDLVRLEQNKVYLTEHVYFSERAKILREYDRFLGSLLDHADLKHSQVMVAALAPTVKANNESRLFTMVGVTGEGIRPGLLKSPTTRREGILTLTDIAPSICQYLQAPLAESFVGRPWQLVSVSNPLSVIKLLDDRAVFINLLRPVLVKGYVILHLIVLSVVLLLLILGSRRCRDLAPLLLGLITVPMVWLLISFFPLTSNWLYIVISLALIIVLVIFSQWVARNKEFDPLIILCLLTVVLLLGDAVTGGYLQKYSVLSYDPMSGARYYGIGNEYMGVLIGAMIMGLTILAQRVHSLSKVPILMAGGGFLLAAIILGAPQIGSNFGGVLAAFFGFAYTWFRLLGVRFHLRQVVIGSVAILALGFIFIFIDYSRPPALRSHFGLLIASIQSGGLPVLWEIITRKLAMNYKLIKYTIWTRVLLGTLLALGILFYRPVGIFKCVLTKYPAIAIGLEGSIVGAFAALFFNDSGIVAAATAIIFPAATLFLLVLQDQNNYQDV